MENNNFNYYSYLYENVSTGKSKRASRGGISQRISKSEAERIKAEARRPREPIVEPKERQKRIGIGVLPSKGIKSGEKVLRGGYARTPEGIARRRASDLERRSREPKVSVQNAVKYITRAEKIKSALKNKKTWGENFDYVLEHLIDEGYVNSYESGISMMNVMSEDWICSILMDKN